MLRVTLLALPSLLPLFVSSFLVSSRERLVIRLFCRSLYKVRVTSKPDGKIEAAPAPSSAHVLLHG
jgi:hypothetical protein